jgi:Ca2+-dependent lipid-binding protein
VAIGFRNESSSFYILSSFVFQSIQSLFVHITPSIQNTTRNDTSSKTTPITGIFTAQIRGLDFKNIESGILGLGAIDPYFELSKLYKGSGDARWHLVYRSEHIHNIINPYWDAFQLDLDKLCHGDVKRELKIAVFDYEKKSSDRYLGEVEVSVDELMKSVTKGGNACREFALRVLDKKEEVVGLLVVLKAEVSSF